jgi:hypothetical protein
VYGGGKVWIAILFSVFGFKTVISTKKPGLNLKKSRTTLVRSRKGFTGSLNLERLDSRKYFRNFTSNDLSVTTACYEAAEGIFRGISHGKRPCHICASVNLDIYNSCIRNGKAGENTPCNRIIAEISSHYKTSSAAAGYSG